MSEALMIKYYNVRARRLQRLFALSLVCCLCSMCAFAQVGEHRNDLSLGFSGGYVMSSVGFVPKVPQGQHAGLTAGFTLRYTCEKYFNSICAIVAELNYAQLGWREDILTPDDEPVINAVTGVAEQYERDLNYIQVPVLARLGWGRERSGLQFFFQVGPQIGAFLSEKTRQNFAWNTMNTADRTSLVVAQDTMAVEHKVDYGIAGGIGVEFSHRKLGHFMLEGRYYYGLGDMYGNSKRDYFGRSNLSNIVVKLTYLFDLVKTRNNKIK